MGKHVVLADGVSIGSDCWLERISIGANSAVDSRVVCTGHGEGLIRMGKECYIGLYNVLDWSDNINIGDYVHIAGPSTGLWTHSSALMCLHGIALEDKRVTHRPTSPIEIGSNVYIGGNCTIYPGVKIGHHAIIAPNSAVTKDVEPYGMVGGVPATLIKRITLGNNHSGVSQ
jgi:acetyltransferase-like isoleucine patch superfamily enzyme